MTTTDSAPEHSAPLSRSFHFFLWTRMLSTAANQILLVALGWQMYDLTASAWDLGLVGLFQFVPTFLLTLPSGQLADRVDRRRLLAAAIALQLVVAAILAWASAAEWAGREIILGLSIFLGAARAPRRDHPRLEHLPRRGARAADPGPAGGRAQAGRDHAAAPRGGIELR